MNRPPDPQPIQAASRDETQLVGNFWPACRSARASLALVHGLGDHSGRYVPLIQELQRASIACVALDLRGHGRSPGQRGHAGSFAQLRQDAHAIFQKAQEAAPGRPVVLLGHSLGGTLVLSLALRCHPPAAALVVLSPLILPTQPPGTLLWYTGHVLSRLVPRFPFRARFPDSRLTHDPEMIEAMRDDRLRSKRVTARLAVEMFREGRWLATQGPNLDYPLLLMHGTDDPLTSFQATRELAESIASGRCTFRAWPGMYHELLTETVRHEVMETIIAYLDSVLPDRPPGSDA